MGRETYTKYLVRYIPGQKIYIESVNPEKIANITIDNTDFDNPVVITAKD